MTANQPPTTDAQHKHTFDDTIAEVRQVRLANEAYYKKHGHYSYEDCSCADNHDWPKPSDLPIEPAKPNASPSRGLKKFADTQASELDEILDNLLPEPEAVVNRATGDPHPELTMLAKHFWSERKAEAKAAISRLLREARIDELEKVWAQAKPAMPINTWVYWRLEELKAQLRNQTNKESKQ